MVDSTPASTAGNPPDDAPTHVEGLEEVADLIVALADVDPAAAADPAERIARLLGDALDGASP